MLSADAIKAEAAEPTAERKLASRQDLQERFLEDIHRYVSSFIANPAEAEDVSMEVLHAAITSFERLCKQENPKLWLIGIARRKVADNLRRSYRRKEVSIGEAGHLAAGQTAETTLHVRAILKRLPELEREALVLKYGMGLSQAEVASVLRKSNAAVNSLLQRARSRFIEIETATLANDRENS
jgi:RNA polymerase sigma-70 factor (ECF subfamily)